MRGEAVLVVANEVEAQANHSSLFFIVNVRAGARAVAGLRVDSIDITQKAVEDPRFYEVYQTLRRSQLKTRR